MVKVVQLVKTVVGLNLYNGFAFGLGLTRLAMMKYKINDIRVLNSGDIRYLEKFRID